MILMYKNFSYIFKCDLIFENTCNTILCQKKKENKSYNLTTSISFYIRF